MKKVIFVSLALSLLAGCASMVVSDDVIVQRTAFALSIDASSFTISSRMDEGTTTRYSVTTKTGRKYHCFLGGSISIAGKSISEAICNALGEPALNPLLERAKKIQ